MDLTGTANWSTYLTAAAAVTTAIGTYGQDSPEVATAATTQLDEYSTCCIQAGEPVPYP